MSKIMEDECKFPNARLMSKGTFYGMHEGEMRCIPIEEYNQHLKNEILLDVLMKAGVHQWCDFEKAMEQYQERLNAPDV